LPVLIQQLREDASDAELLDRYVRHRADDAFTLLVSRYGRLVWGQCRNLLANEADAEDAFQATFLVLARSAKSIRPGSPLGPWLHGAAFRVCQNAHRAAARRTRHEGKSSRPEASHPVSESAWEIAFATLSEEVQKLPVAQRAVFVLCGLEGRTEGEAAIKLGQKVGTVSSRLARAKQTLLDRLSKRGFGTGAAVLGGIAASSADAPAAVTTRALSILLSKGEVPATIQSLTRGVTGMAFVRFKLLVAGVLLAAGLTFGAASGWFGTAAAQPAPEKAPPSPREQAKPKPEKEDEDPRKAALAAKLKDLAYPGAKPEDDNIFQSVGQTIHFTTDDLKTVEKWYREKLDLMEGMGNGVAYLPWPAGETVLVKERRTISIAQDEIRPNREKKDYKTVREPTVRNFAVRTPEGTIVVLLNRIAGDKETMIAVTYMPPVVAGSRDTAAAPEDLRDGAGEVLVIEVTESKTTLPPVGSPTTVTAAAVVKHVESSATKLKVGDAIKLEYGIPGAGAVDPPVMLKEGDVRVAYLNFDAKTKTYSTAANGKSFSGVIESPKDPVPLPGAPNAKPDKSKDPLKVGGELPFVVVTFLAGTEVGEGSPGVMIGNSKARCLVVWSRKTDEVGMALARSLEGIADDKAQRYFVTFDDTEAAQKELGKAGLKKVVAGRSRKPSAEVFERAGLDEKVDHVITLLDGKEVKAIWTLTAGEATEKKRKAVMAEAEKGLELLSHPKGDSAPSGHKAAYVPFDDVVYREVSNAGPTTARSVVIGLDRRGVKCKTADVQAAMNRWVARGWMEVTDGKTSLRSIESH